MEFYGDPNCCDTAPEPMPIDVPEPAPLPAFEPPAPAPPAAEIFPDPPAAPIDVAPAPAAPVDAGTLLGPSTVGASADLGGGFVGGTPDLSGSSFVGGTPDLGGSGFVGGTPDLGGSGFVGGTPDLSASGSVTGPADLGMTWVDSHGTPVPAPNIPIVPGPFNAAAANIVGAANSGIVDNVLGSSGSNPYPAPWTPGFDSDHDGIVNERDPNPRDRFS